MLSHELRQTLKPLIIVQKIIWWALTLSIFIYVGVAFLMLRGPFDNPAGGVDGAPEALAPVFHALGIGAAFLSVAYWRRTLSEERVRARLAKSPDFGVRGSGEVASMLQAARAQAHENLSPQDRRLLFLAGSLTVPILVSLAANEAVAIFGLVLALLSGAPRAILPFAIVAVFLNLLMFPRTAEILARSQGWASLGGADAGPAGGGVP